MDNLCHTLVGAAFGEAGLKRRTRFGNTTLMIAANLPDVDVLVFATGVPSVALRRGWTHGALALALLPVALTAAMWAVSRMCPARGDRNPIRARALLLLSYVGVLSHVGLDLLNNYGVRLLMPFDRRWFYGDILFIIDPWLWLVLGAGVWLARRRGAPHVASQALIVAAFYVGAMCVSARLARHVVLDEWRAARGGELLSLMVGPSPITPFRRQVIVDAGTHYETGTFDWLPTQVRFDSEKVPKNDHDPRVAQAREAPRIRGFLIWSRFPFWTLEAVSGGTRVTVSDLRFVGRGGPFVQSTLVR
ncbi:MAG: metal-dependent hydrolase [Acidobacteria bacterium]|nr:metal-dependent hydrolase [Acidobacteriota bacterium]